MSYVNRTWRPLDADGGDVGKPGIPYFEADSCWVDVIVNSFTPAEERILSSRSKRKMKHQLKRGSYSFKFVLRDEEGKPQTENGKAVDECDWDDLSVGDASVRVQDGWGI